MTVSLFKNPKVYSLKKYLDFTARNTAILCDELAIVEVYLRSLNMFESQRLVDSEKARDCNKFKLWNYGYKVFSQNDEDGIIAEIFKRIGTTNRSFIEFGVEDGNQCNTAALLIEGWSGLWIEFGEGYVEQLNKVQEQFKGKLRFKRALVSAENINELLKDFPEVDLLSIDIDYNDYWVWKAITVVNPRVVVIEYNALFPPPISVTVPYDATNYQGGKGSNHFGASLEAMTRLASDKGYRLVGCNFTGSNAFYVRNDLVCDRFSELEPFTAENHYEPIRYNVRQGQLGNNVSKVAPYVEIKSSE